MSNSKTEVNSRTAPKQTTDLSKMSYLQLDGIKHQARSVGDTQLANAAETQQFVLEDKAYHNP